MRALVLDRPGPLGGERPLGGEGPIRLRDVPDPGPARVSSSSGSGPAASAGPTCSCAKATWPPIGCRSCLATRSSAPWRRWAPASRAWRPASGRRRVARGHLRGVRRLPVRAGEPLRGGHVHRLGPRRRLRRAHRRAGRLRPPSSPGFGDRAAAPLLCGGAIGYRSLRVSGVRRRAAGPLRLRRLGHITIQVARHWGCEVHVATRSARSRAGARPRCRVGRRVRGAAARPARRRHHVRAGRRRGDRRPPRSRSRWHGGDQRHPPRPHPRVPYEMLWWERRLRSVANFTRDVAELLELAASIPVVTETEVFDLPKPGRPWPAWPPEPWTGRRCSCRDRASGDRRAGLPPARSP